jgi:hypothetical protein
LDVKNTTLQGSVIVTPADYAQCTSQEDALQDFVLSARTIAQKAYDLGASMLIIYGRDSVAKPSWSRSRTLARRNDIPIPVLLISDNDGEALSSLMSNSTAPVEIQLSKEPYCDSVYRYGIPLDADQSPACCAAADTIMAYNLFSTDFTICPQSLSGLNVTCETSRAGFLNSDSCGVGSIEDYTNNGVCEDSGDNSDFSICAIGTDFTG